MVLDQSHIDPKRRACGGLRQFNFTHFFLEGKTNDHVGHAPPQSKPFIHSFIDVTLIDHGGFPREGLSFSVRETDNQEIETLKALRASLEAIKQVVQGVHDDLAVSQQNYKELTGTLPLFSITHDRATTEMDGDNRSS